MKADPPRCPWSGTDPLYIAYHDEEWGVPLHDDRALFELLILEGAQAGLSWITILRKRAAYREAFDNFDADRIARYIADRPACNSDCVLSKSAIGTRDPVECESVSHVK